MTQEDKDLLLKNLCVRLPYGVKVRYSSYNKFIICTLQSINPVYNNIDLWSKDACFNSVGINKIKPYLFPLSSMTAEQKREYTHIVVMSGNIATFQSIGMTVQDWFSKSHFDYRNLIEKGLAIDCTNLNIY